MGGAAVDEKSYLKDCLLRQLLFTNMNAEYVF